VFQDAGVSFEQVRIVTADSRVTYLAEVFHPDLVDIGSGILRIGSASYEIGQALFQKGRCVGLCVTTFVQADAGGARPLGGDFRKVLEGLMMTAPAEV
jgi:acyl-CoA thioester hydrolase